MNKLKPILGLLFYFSSMTEATVFCDMDTTSLIKCTLSSRHHNRIALSQGHIIKVIFPESDISVRLEEESGQVFVQAMRNEIQPTTVSLVTDNGVVQDLELDFTNKSSEILILNVPTELDECSDKNDIFNQDIADTLDQILSGQAPNGYSSYEEDCEEILIRKGIYATKKAKFVGPFQTLYLWEVQNKSPFKKQVCEMDLNFEGTIWVYLAKSCLGCKEKTIAITAKTHE